MVVHQLIYVALCPSLRWHRLTHCKVLNGPVWHVTLIKNYLVAAGPHHSSLQNLMFKVGVSVPEKAHLESVLVVVRDIGRRNDDRALARAFVEVHQVLDGIHPTNGAKVRQICLYPGLDCAVK